MIPTTQAHDANTQIALSAMEAHLHNLRSMLPPHVRSACLPDSTSALLRNVLLTAGALNCLLVLGSLFSIGARYVGISVMLASLLSLAHVSFACMVLGGHLTTVVGARYPALASVLRGTSERYESDAFAYGAVFGSAVITAALMHVLSSFYGGLSECVANTAASSAAMIIHHNLTGGYASSGEASIAGPSGPYATCGASGPVGFVSLISGLLSWTDAVLAAVLYVKREELLSGGGGSSYSAQYDEIGGGHNNSGFEGDFPAIQEARTMHV